MADFVDIAYLTQALGLPQATMQTRMQAVVLQKAILDGLGVRPTADVTTAVNPITRTVRLAFGPSGLSDAVPVVRPDGTIFGITLGNRGNDYIRPPFVTLLPRERFAAQLSAFLRVLNFTIVTGGAGYATAPTVAFIGGLPPAGRTFLGCVRRIFLKDSGRGYPPTTTISIDGGSINGNSPAIPATALPTIDAFGRIVAVTLTNMGANYTSVPKVAFNTGGIQPARAAQAFVAMADGNAARATATIAANVVNAILLTDAGTGYIGVPDIVLTGGGFATIAQVTARMELERVDVRYAGAGYPAVGTTVVFTPFFKQRFSDVSDQGAPFARIFQAQFVRDVVAPMISAAPVLI